jgi:hypothetical protein
VWDSLAPWLAQGGIVSVLAWVGYRLHADAIGAERRRADDWRTAWQAERDRADVRDGQIGILLGRTPVAKEPA